MQYAAFGQGYKQTVGHIHYNADNWSFDRLVDFAMKGRIIDWYIMKLQRQGIEFSEEDIARIKGNTDLQILSAYFHRYKIAEERIHKAKQILWEGVGTFLPRFSKWRSPSSYQAILNDPTVQLIPRIKPVIQELGDFALKLQERSLDTPLQIALTNTQCLMFYIVKHKGQLPPGFVMDERIRQGAYTPLNIGRNSSNLNSSLAPSATKIDPVLNWMRFLEINYRELQDPQVTYGVIAERDYR